MAEQGPIVRPAWPRLAHDQYDDSIFWLGRELVPADPDASPGRRSEMVCLVGVTAVDLAVAKHDYPHLAPAVAYGDSNGDVRAGELPPGVKFGEHKNGIHIMRLFAAVELGWYPFLVSLGLWKPGHSFIEPVRQFGGPEEAIKIFWVDDKKYVQQAQPDIPIVERLLNF